MESRQYRRGGILRSDSAGNISSRRHRPDYLLIVMPLLLVMIGLGVIYSIGPAMSAIDHVGQNYFVEKQLLAVVLAAIVFFAASRVPLGIWRKWTKPLLVVAVLATLIALVLPVNPDYPAHRWVRLGGLSFQSVELLKLALLVWLADLLANRSSRAQNLKKVFRSLVATLLLVGLIVAGLQSDLGSAGVILAMLFAMAFTAGVPLKRIGVFVIVIALVGLAAVAISPYRRARVTAFLNQGQNCQTASGWQSCQAMISVGSGGMFGLGLGRSVQAYGYLPQAANDSIFAVYAEKFGFVGCIILLGIFAIFFGRIKRIAERAPDEYSRLLVLGVLVWLAVEALINIGGMIGVMPMKGITLPFISYGGTSMIFSGAAVGLVFQVSKYTTFSSPRIRMKKELDYEDIANRRRVGRPYYAATGSRR